MTKQLCENCRNEFDPDQLVDCPHCQGGTAAVCSHCNRVCDPLDCPMSNCPHKPDLI